MKETNEEIQRTKKKKKKMESLEKSFKEVTTHFIFLNEKKRGIFYGPLPRTFLINVPSRYLRFKGNDLENKDV